jgi:CheY-like chemotaxis protein
LLTRSLELQGHRVASAENGRIALDKLRAEAFDLLLLDMEMPEMNGFEVMEQLAADTSLRDLPVIVTSSLEDLTHVVRCIELGADDFLRKPVNPVPLRGASAPASRKALARPTEGNGQALRHLRGGRRPAAIGLCARWPARARHRDVCRHPRLHGDRGSANARGND